MIIARVFPRRTKATPVDDLAIIGSPDLFSHSLKVDKIHISVTFSWDLFEAERLYRQWNLIAPTEIGGPAIGQAGGNFTPGMYLKKGYVITSRGCPNRCWFCSVPKREGPLRELPVTDGWNVLDDNLLACSDKHIQNVFAMLARQKQRPLLTGGLEAARLKLWHVQALKKIKAKRLFFAYDGPEDREPLFEAGNMLLSNGFTRESHALRAYVLIGYQHDTLEKAEHRLHETMEAGFMPMAMLYRDKTGDREDTWRRFAGQWSRPAIISKTYKKYSGKK
jgi:hypothetical protein